MLARTLFFNLDLGQEILPPSSYLDYLTYKENLIPVGTWHCRDLRWPGFP